MFNYVARQPILDADLKLCGYELLFRDGLQNAFPNINPHEATSRLLSNSHFHLGLDSLTGELPAFINFPEVSLLVKVPALLPKEQVVVEVLEDIAPTQTMLAACQELKNAGYTIALDDFNYDSDWQPLMPMVDIVKLDFLATPRMKLLKICNELKSYGVRLLAEKVETHEDVEFAQRIGCTAFQGYFFSRPEIVKRRALSPSQTNLLLLLSKVSQPDIQISELEEIVQNDVSISYKLLRYVNSPVFAKARKVESIRQALAYLGANEIKKFVALMAAANLAADKPEELIKLSIVRARFCELIAHKHQPRLAEQAFLAGLFSLIDAILDTPAAEVMEKLPLCETIKAAIIKGEGPLADFIRLIKDYEKAVWHGVNALSERIGIDADDLPEFYVNAVDWSNEFVRD